MASHEHESSKTKTKRKLKSKSFVVNTKTDPNNVNRICLSAECDSSTFGLRSFSFRRFGRGRSTSKQSLTDSNSASDIDCVDCASFTSSTSNPSNPSNPTTPMIDFSQMKCPIITYDEVDHAPANLQIESK